MASKVVGLSTQLNWASFRTKNAAPPAPGTFGSAAFTQTGFKVTGLNLVPVEAGKSADLKLEDKIEMHVSLDIGASWVASWVKQRPEPERAKLLKHEQGHYDLVALLARDCFEALMPLRDKTWTTAQDMQTDVNKIMDPFNAKIRPIQDEYDDKTDHGDKQAEQDKWNRMIREADTDIDPPEKAVDSAFRKKPILSVLATYGITP